MARVLCLPPGANQRATRLPATAAIPLIRAQARATSRTSIVLGAFCLRITSCRSTHMPMIGTSQAVEMQLAKQAHRDG